MKNNIDVESEFELFKKVFIWVNNLNDRPSVESIPVAINLFNCLKEVRVNCPEEAREGVVRSTKDDLRLTEEK